MTPPTTVRLPPGLRSEAEIYADSVGCSLSGLIGVALRDYLDARRAPVALSPSPAVSIEPVEAAPAVHEAVRTRGVASRPSPVRVDPPAKVRGPKFNDPCACGSGKKYGKCHGVDDRKRRK